MNYNSNFEWNLLARSSTESQHRTKNCICSHSSWNSRFIFLRKWSLKTSNGEKRCVEFNTNLILLFWRAFRNKQNLQLEFLFMCFRNFILECLFLHFIDNSYFRGTRNSRFFDTFSDDPNDILQGIEPLTRTQCFHLKHLVLLPLLLRMPKSISITTNRRIWTSCFIFESMTEVSMLFSAWNSKIWISLRRNRSLLIMSLSHWLS